MELLKNGEFTDLISLVSRICIEAGFFPAIYVESAIHSVMVGKMLTSWYCSCHYFVLEPSEQRPFCEAAEKKC